MIHYRQDPPSAKKGWRDELKSNTEGFWSMSRTESQAHHMRPAGVRNAKDMAAVPISLSSGDANDFGLDSPSNPHHKTG